MRAQLRALHVADGNKLGSRENGDMAFHHRRIPPTQDDALATPQPRGIVGQNTQR